MLSELTITNFAIVERQSLSFHRGFNVISGETGAGKSIILHAIEFILGARISPATIRSGAEQLEVQALFDLSGVPAHIRADLPEVVGGDELVVSRTLPREGRGKVLINGRLGTVSLLEEIIRKIVNICSQHHHTRLLDPRYHLELLDGFAAQDSLLAEMREAYRAWHEQKLALEAIKAAQGKSAFRRAELEELIRDLTAVPGLAPGRREHLEIEVKRLGNAERLIALGQRALEALAGEDGVPQLLKSISGALQEMQRLDPGVEKVLESFETARDAVISSEADLDRYVGSLEVDGEALEAVRLELSDLARLERKYRTTDLGLCERRDDAERELRLLGDGQGALALEREVSELERAMRKVATKLREVRRKAGKELCARVAKDLHELNMLDASLEVKVTEAEPTVFGLDRVEFLISTNRGELHKPLVQIASGGELSRVMLVLKKILRERSGVNVLIFDEVDTGISGGVARSVGQMLREISTQSQVVCITHLPQVASLSDRHFLVNKELGDRAITVVKQLSDDEKVDEIARMLAGYKITDASRASARELIASK